MPNSPLTPVAQQVCEKRYFRKDDDGNLIEDWNGLVERVVNYVGKNDTDEFRQKAFNLIYNTEFLPNSPCLVNAGRKNKSAGLLACFVTKPPEDSWIEMVDNIARFGHVARQGGGCGVDLSKIRPEGDPVFGSTHAKACGPIEHMRMISEVMSSITQSGFRGMAMLAAMRVDHPDIMKFITCKQRDRALKTMLKEDIFDHYGALKDERHEHLNIILDKFIYNFNVSVFATDEFMEKVENDEEYNLVFGGKVYATVRAKAIFDMITHNAWKNGDPGLLFHDTINDGPYKYSGQTITATNPCFHGDSMVAVADGRGFVSIKELAEEGKDVPVYCADPKDGSVHIRVGRHPRKTKNEANLYKVTFENGSIITTPDHKICLKNGEYVEVKDLAPEASVMAMMDSQTVSVRVVSAEYMDETDDVYNITVDEHHNLYISPNASSETKQVDVSTYKSIVYRNCGEQTLPFFGSCNLGSIDVSKFYNTKREIYEWSKLRDAIETAMQFLDNVLDINTFPTPDFAKWAKENRPVGLGIMGWADVLLKMKIAYGSDDSIKFANKLGKFFQSTAHDKSVALGKERGTPKCCRYDELEHRRNVTTLSIAPTGTISLLAGCSSSIEPIFSAITYRYDNTGSKEIKHPLASRSYFRCASDLPWQDHVAMQAAFQPYIDSAISKTINCPNDATVQDVFDAYMYAWKNKCKGITIYRDGSKTTQVLNSHTKPVVGANQAKERPKVVDADIFKARADGFDWHVIVGKVDDVPYEIFAVNGKTSLPGSGKVIKRKRRHYSLLDDDENVLIDNIGVEEEKIHPRIGLETRRFSLELRHNIDPKYIVEQIDKSNDLLVTSYSKVVGGIMKHKYISCSELAGVVDIACPECGRNGEHIEMIAEAGCWSCPKCRYSRCG